MATTYKPTTYFTDSWMHPDRGMEDIYTDKEAVWDAVVGEYPLLAQSTIFKEGFDRWKTGGGLSQKFRNLVGPILDKYGDAGATGWGSHINVQSDPEADERDTHALMAHELPHLGMRIDENFSLNPFTIKRNIELEEKLNRMHDVLYQPTGYMGTQHKKQLMNEGYFDRIPGGPGYAGGHQYSDKGNEFIRTSGLPQRHQRGLGYYESPNSEQLDKQRQSTINWLDSRIGGSPQRSGNRPTIADVAGPVSDRRPNPHQDFPVSNRRPNPHQDFNGGGIASLGGQWSPSVIEGDEEIYDIKPLQMDPGIMSIDDLEDLFEEAGLDKRIIYQLINTGGLSQFVV